MSDRKLVFPVIAEMGWNGETRNSRTFFHANTSYRPTNEDASGSKWWQAVKDIGAYRYIFINNRPTTNFLSICTCNFDKHYWGGAGYYTYMFNGPECRAIGRTPDTMIAIEEVFYHNPHPHARFDS